jgi:molybdate transport system permease protein
VIIPDLSPIWISLKVSIVATLIVALTGTIAAHSLYPVKTRRRSLLEAILIAPMIVPPTVVGFILLIGLGRNGIIGQALAQWHINLIFTWYAAAIAAAVVSFPLMYRSAIAAFEQVDQKLLDAARVEGASEGAVFWYILLPLAMPGIVSGTILTFARALGEFGATLMVAGNVPGQTQTMAMAIYFAVEAGAIAEAWFWVILILGLSLVGISVGIWMIRRSRA